MWWRKRTQSDFEDEIQAHLQFEIDRRIAEGSSEADARAATLREFGNVTAAQEHFYESHRWLWADHLIRDLRYAGRVLRKNLQSSVIAIATMALGIGSASAIFTVVNAVLLRPLPYPESDRLVMCVQNHVKFGPEIVSLPDYVQWRDQSTTFESLAGVWNQVINLTGVEEPERLAGAAVTANLFQALRTPPMLGRVMSDDAERNVVVIGHSLWRRQFAGNHNIIGKTISLNGKPHQIIGVMPAGFSFPALAELWTPLVPEPSMNRGYHQLWVVGRLKPSASIDQAGAELASIAAQAEQQFPNTNKNWGAQVSKLRDHIVGASKRSLLIIAGAVGCLLLLACANVAGLLMSRSLARRHEMSIRAALGAPRWQIIRQLLTESLLLAAIGAALGLGIAAWSIQPLLSFTSIPRASEVSLDFTVAAFAILAAITTGVLFGLAPAIEATEWARDELRLRGAHTIRVRPLLVAFQIALATILLSGAGLLMRSFHRLQQVDTGLSADRVLTVRFFLPRATYPAERCVQLYQRMIQEMKRLPGVETAAAVSSFPLSGSNANVGFQIPGRTLAEGEMLTAEFRAATPEYFQTVGLSVLDGRGFDSDSAESQFVAVVNRAFAERFFSGRNPIGESVRILGPKPRTIVGVIPNIRHRGLDSPPEPEIYVPHTQFPTGGMFLAIRTRVEDPLTLAGAVRGALRGIDSGLPIARIQSWNQTVDQTLHTRRFSVILLSLFAGLALLLSVIGIYGMVSFHVSQRTREIGIRMAMGEAPVAAVRGAVRKGMTPVALGLGLGFIGAIATTHLLKALLFEIRPTDPATLTATIVLLLAAAFAASFLPARRAATVDPMVALRHE